MSQYEREWLLYVTGVITGMERRVKSAESTT